MDVFKKLRWVENALGACGPVVLSTVLIAALVFLFSRSAEAHDCPVLGDCHPVCDEDALADCKISGDDRWSWDRLCGYVQHHPDKEHVIYAFLQTKHCLEIGGVLQGGLTDDHCRNVRGMFAAAPNLRAVFGAETLGVAAHRCGHDAGIPPEALAFGDDPQGREWDRGWQNCGNYSAWSIYYANKERMDANVPKSCIHWSL